jgi:hypothetical protein
MRSIRALSDQTKSDSAPNFLTLCVLAAHGLPSVPGDAGPMLTQTDNSRDHLHGSVVGASESVHDLGPDVRSVQAPRNTRADCLYHFYDADKFMCDDYK